MYRKMSQERIKLQNIYKKSWNAVHQFDSYLIIDQKSPCKSSLSFSGSVKKYTNNCRAILTLSLFLIEADLSWNSSRKLVARCSSSFIALASRSSSWVVLVNPFSRHVEQRERFWSRLATKSNTWVTATLDTSSAAVDSAIAAFRASVSSSKVWKMLWESC